MQDTKLRVQGHSSCKPLPSGHLHPPNQCQLCVAFRSRLKELTLGLKPSENTRSLAFHALPPIPSSAGFSGAPPAPDAPRAHCPELGVTSRARSRPAAGGRCTAVPLSRVPGAAGLRAREQRRLRLPAAAAETAPAPAPRAD